AIILLGTVFAEPVFTGILIIALAPLLIVTLLWPPRTSRTTRVVVSLFLADIAALAASLTASLGEWWILLGALLATGALAAVRVLEGPSPPAPRGPHPHFQHGQLAPCTHWLEFRSRVEMQPPLLARCTRDLRALSCHQQIMLRTHRR